LRYEEAKLNSGVPVDEQHGRVVGSVTLLDDVGWDCFPLAILQVLPLVRTVVANPETGLEDITVVAAGLPGNTEPLPGGGIHFLPIEPFMVGHRRVVSVGAEGKHANAENQDATERFHGSLHCGLSLVSASANHAELSGNPSGHNIAKRESHFRPADFFARDCCFSVLGESGPDLAGDVRRKCTIPYARDCAPLLARADEVVQ
jgi:hypothetical protein